MLKINNNNKIILRVIVFTQCEVCTKHLALGAIAMSLINSIVTDDICFIP